MKLFLRRSKHVAIFFLSLALAGCLGGQSGSTNFYMLSPMSPFQAGTSPETAEARIIIGLETVVVAEYLNHKDQAVQRYGKDYKALLREAEEAKGQCEQNLDNP